MVVTAARSSERMLREPGGGQSPAREVCEIRHHRRRRVLLDVLEESRACCASALLCWDLLVNSLLSSVQEVPAGDEQEAVGIGARNDAGSELWFGALDELLSALEDNPPVHGLRTTDGLSLRRQQRQVCVEEGERSREVSKAPSRLYERMCGCCRPRLPLGAGASADGSAKSRAAGDDGATRSSTASAANPATAASSPPSPWVRSLPAWAGVRPRRTTFLPAVGSVTRGTASGAAADPLDELAVGQQRAPARPPARSPRPPGRNRGGIEGRVNVEIPQPPPAGRPSTVRSPRAARAVRKSTQA